MSNERIHFDRIQGLLLAKVSEAYQQARMWEKKIPKARERKDDYIEYSREWREIYRHWAQTLEWFNAQSGLAIVDRRTPDVPRG